MALPDGESDGAWDQEPDESRPAELQRPSWIDRITEVRFVQYLDKWRRRIRTHPQTGLPLKPLRPRSADDDDELSIERLAFKTGRGLKVALRIFAPACLGLFLLSFAFNPYEIVRTCSVAGLIGFGTNWIAIKMLFRPRESRPVFGQGLIPSQRDEIIRKVADEVLEKLINERIIRQEIEESRLISRLTEETSQEVRRLVRDPEFVSDTKQLVLTYAAEVARSEKFREELMRDIEKRVEHVAGRSFTSWLVNGLRGVWREPIVRLVNSELDRLPETLDRMVDEVDEALNHIPHYLEEKAETIDAALTRVVMSLIREIDVRGVVLKQLSTVTSDQLETGFREFADDKLSYITLLGGLLGLIGGFVIIWPIQTAMGLVALLLVLLGADVAAHALLQRRRRRRARVEAADGGGTVSG